MVGSALLVSLLGTLCGFVTCADDLKSTQFQVNRASNPTVNLNESKIVNAQPSIVQHSWIAGLYKIPNQNRRSYIRYVCTVTLFTRKMGLTSAHCFDSTEGNFFELFYWRLKVNSNQVYRGGNADLKGLIRHPGYTKPVRAANGRFNAGSYDMAVVIVDTLPFEPHVQLVGIAPPPNYHSQRAGFLFAFGRIDPARYPNPEQELRYSPVVMTDTDDCAFGNTFDHTATCWKTTDGSRPCNGDSGGPVMFYQHDGTQIVMGMMSYGGTGCNSPAAACTDFQILEIHDWISRIITEYS